MCACPHVMREVWKINLNDSMTLMRVCPDSERQSKKWREQMLVTWEQSSILYAIGCTHTIDGKGDRKLPEPDKMRIADVGKSPCVNAGLRAEDPAQPRTYTTHPLFLLVSVVGSKQCYLKPPLVFCDTLLLQRRAREMEVSDCVRKTLNKERQALPSVIVYIDSQGQVWHDLDYVYHSLAPLQGANRKGNFYRDCGNYWRRAQLPAWARILQNSGNAHDIGG